MTSLTLSPTVDAGLDLRGFCRGLTPLEPRLEPWHIQLADDSERLQQLIAAHGSPVHVMNASPFARNGQALERVASAAGVDLQIYFARKANKALSFVDAARDAGWGVDVAGFEELTQTLGRAVAADRLVVTAAVKPRRLLELAAERRVLVALDNAHEVEALAEAAAAFGDPRPLPVALRLSGFAHQGAKLFSRFGFDIDTVEAEILELWRQPHVAERLAIRGLHFHLDGYDPDQRVSALGQSLELGDRLSEASSGGLRQRLGQGVDRRGVDFRFDFIDIGGGLPMRYLDDEAQWQTFWRRLDAAILGDSEPITYRNDGLGKLAVEGRVVGRVASYPYYQELVAETWLEQVLRSRMPGFDETVARGLQRRNLQLRCEPGRSLLDGCGLTVARVEWTKPHPDGHVIAALDMNRTQCRTGSVDFLVDPLVIPKTPRGAVELQAGACLPVTYLTGAYCIENEMLSWRGLLCPYGLEAGDLVVWPNTAGYFMHFLESRSHQFPLAHNLVFDPLSGHLERDPIDAVP